MQIGPLEQQRAPPRLLLYLDVGVEGLTANATFSLFTTFAAKKQTFTADSAAGRVYSTASTKSNHNSEIFKSTITWGVLA